MFNEIDALSLKEYNEYLEKMREFIMSSLGLPPHLCKHLCKPAEKPLMTMRQLLDILKTATPEERQEFSAWWTAVPAPEYGPSPLTSLRKNFVGWGHTKAHWIPEDYGYGAIATIARIRQKHPGIDGRKRFCLLVFDQQAAVAMTKKMGGSFYACDWQKVPMGMHFDVIITNGFESFDRDHWRTRFRDRQYSRFVDSFAELEKFLELDDLIEKEPLLQQIPPHVVPSLEAMIEHQRKYGGVVVGPNNLHAALVEEPVESESPTDEWIDPDDVQPDHVR